MKNSERRYFVSVIVVMLVGILVSSNNVVRAHSQSYLENLNVGVAKIVDPSAQKTVSVLEELSADLNLNLEEVEFNNLVMADVNQAVNVRAEASAESEKVGVLYKDCGGVILERGDGWTKIQSGELIGWCSNEYLALGNDAVKIAEDVCIIVGEVQTDALRVRTEPSEESGLYGLLPRNEMVVVLEDLESEWLLIDYNGEDGYIKAEYVTIDYLIDKGETIEQIKEREAAELEAKRHVNYGQYTTGVDDLKLLAALIHCEAGGESYEGQVAVGAVVLNRVRSAAYQDSIHAVIYASGQFSPAISGSLNARLESGNISASCMKAAEEALSGVSPVGASLYFRRNNGSREGIVIGNHVFY